MRWFLILGVAVLAGGCGTTKPPEPKVLYTDAVDVSTTKGLFTIELFWNDSPVATTEFVRAVNFKYHVGRRFSPKTEPNGALFEIVHVQVKRSDRKYRDVVISRQPGFVRGMVGMIRVDTKEGSPFQNYSTGFFICRKIRNPKLNLLNGVYTVVGQVTRGMEVVDRLGPKDRVLSVTKRRVRARHDGVFVDGVPKEFVGDVPLKKDKEK